MKEPAYWSFFAQNSFVHEQSDGYVWPDDPAVLEKLDQWQDLKFGVGPTPDGVIEDKAIVILQEIGAWLRRCGEAIYSTRITDHYNDGNIWFNASKDGKTLYAIYALPDGENLPAELTWTGNLPKGKITVLNNGKKVKAVVKDGQVTVKLPKGLANEPIALKFSL